MSILERGRGGGGGGKKITTPLELYERECFKLGKEKKKKKKKKKEGKGFAGQYTVYRPGDDRHRGIQHLQESEERG